MTHTDIDCPYCGHGQDVNHDDGAGYEEGEKHEMQCYECEKYFIFETEISFDYEPHQADCLNDGKHDLVTRVTCDSSYHITRTHCKNCDRKNETTYIEVEEAES